MWHNPKVPWDGPGELVLWAGAMVLVAFGLHNLMRAYKNH